MTADEYQDLAMRTASDYGYTLTEKQMKLMNSASGMCGETGEVMDHIKKHCFHGHDLDPAHLAEEIGDALWYIQRAASTLGLNLSWIMQKNIEKLQMRYPNSFSHEDSINRDVDAESEIFSIGEGV